MADNTHDVGLTAFVVDGIAHDFPIDRETFVLTAVCFVPALQCAVKMHWSYPNENVSNGIQARHDIAFVVKPAAKALPGFLTKALSPIRDGQIALSSAQNRASCDGQYRGQSMALSLGAAWIGNVGEKFGQRLHVLGADHHVRFSCIISRFKYM